MHPEDDSKTTLSKWPFILGDVFLVGTALAIAGLGEWQLSNWQVASCVMAVALGAGLYVLPFVVEFRVRVAEETQDRNAKLRSLERHVQNVAQETERLDKWVREHTAASGLDSEIADRVDEEMELLRQRMDQFSASIEGLRSKELELLRSRIVALETRAVEGSESSEPPVQVEEESHELDFEQVSKEPLKKPERGTQSDIERSKPERKVRNRPDEPGLLERAISEEQRGFSSAVTRIIGRKEKHQEPVAELTPADLPPPGAEIVLNQPSEAKTEEVGEIEEEKLTEETRIVDEDADSAAEDSNSEVDRSNGDAVKALERPKTEMLFAEDPAPAQSRKKRVKKDDAVLTASVFIGIGNKPFLRGSGAGLSWEKGQVMEFQEIGKWRWVAPSELEAPIEVQIFRNDEDGDQSGKYTLESGQKLEVSPVF